jgi:1,4-dihydroxy-2-naphthoate octaprenyltransferase
MEQTQLNTISKFDAWVLASRPRTLLAAIAPVVVGTTIAIHDGKFNFIASIFALLCSLLIQIGTNFTNDLFDFLKGTDKGERLGPTRAAASGMLSISEMKYGVFLAFGTAFLLGLYLVYLGGLNVLLIGVASICRHCRNLLRSGS